MHRYGLSDKGLLLTVSVISMAALFACWLAVRVAVTEILKFEAVDAATSWASFLRDDLPTLPNILAGDPMTPEDMQSLAAAQQAAGIFRYKFFGADGLIVQASRPDDVGQTNTKPYFTEIVRAGGTFAKVEEEEDFGNRAVVSEAYVPIMQDGRFLGAIEIYVDRSERAAALTHKGNQAFAALALLLAMFTGAAGAAVATNLRRHKEAAAALRKSERLLRDAQRTAALGKLAGGIAHELNNALQPIVTLSQLTLKNGGLPDKAMDRIGHVLAAAERSREIVQSILRFVGGQTEHREPVPIADALAEIVTFSREVMPNAVVIETSIKDNGAAHVNRVGLAQVMTNLLTNAADAIGQDGKIVVSLDRCAVAASDAAGDGLAPGDYLRIGVADQGPGMTDDVKAHIFDPFFTTKTAGKGTGLGLAVVYGFIRDWGGRISVDSRHGAGTRFDILLPRLAAT